MTRAQLLTALAIGASLPIANATGQTVRPSVNVSPRGAGSSSLPVPPNGVARSRPGAGTPSGGASASSPPAKASAPPLEIKITAEGERTYEVIKDVDGTSHRYPLSTAPASARAPRKGDCTTCVTGGTDDTTTNPPAKDAPPSQVVRDRTVRLIYKTEGRYCTGTLIDDTWVLSAAHCMSEVPTDVSVGAETANQPTVAVAECFLAPGAILSHASCGTFSDVEADALRVPAHDLALLRLTDRVVPTLAVPASVLRASDAAQALPGKKLRVVGFGNTQLGNGSCPNKESSPPTVRQYAVETCRSVGASGINLVADKPGTLISIGDSGGPAFLPNGTTDEILVGINVSSDCVSQSLAASTSDSANAAWIGRLVPKVTWVGTCP